MKRFSLGINNNNKDKENKEPILAATPANTNTNNEETTSSSPATSLPPTHAKDQSSASAAAAAASEVPSCFRDTHGVITATTNDLPGFRVTATLGTIYGITVRSRNWGTDIGAFLKSSTGGEIKYFTTLMYASREAAMERLVGECLTRGGNAVLGLRFDMSEVNTFSQVCAYGTAVVVEKIE